MRAIVAALAVVVAATGCIETMNAAEDADCGDGEKVDLPRGPGCRFGGPIIETGFACPAEFPNEYRVDGEVVCAAEAQPPGAWPAEAPDDRPALPDEDRLPEPGARPDAGVGAAPPATCRASHWEKIGGEWVCLPDDPEAATWCGCAVDENPDAEFRERLPEGSCIAQIGRVRYGDDAIVLELFGDCVLSGPMYTDQFGDGGPRPVAPGETRWLFTVRLAPDLPRGVPLDLGALPLDQLSYVIGNRTSDWSPDGPCPVAPGQRPGDPPRRACRGWQFEEYVGSHPRLHRPRGTLILAEGRVLVEMLGGVCGLRGHGGDWREHCTAHSSGQEGDLRLFIDANLGAGGALERADVPGIWGGGHTGPRLDLVDALPPDFGSGLPAPEPGPSDPAAPPGPSDAFACGASDWAWTDEGWVCRPEDPAAARWCGCAGDDTRPELREPWQRGCSAQAGRVRERPDGVDIELLGQCYTGGRVFTDASGAGGASEVLPGETQWGLVIRLHGDVPRGEPIDLRSLPDDALSWALTWPGDFGFQQAFCTPGDRDASPLCAVLSDGETFMEMQTYSGPHPLLEKPAGTVALAEGRLFLDLPAYVCGLRPYAEGGFWQNCVGWVRSDGPGLRIDAALGPDGELTWSQVPGTLGGGLTAVRGGGL